MTHSFTHPLSVSLFAFHSVSLRLSPRVLPFRVMETNEEKRRGRNVFRFAYFTLPFFATVFVVSLLDQPTIKVVILRVVSALGVLVTGTLVSALRADGSGRFGP